MVFQERDVCAQIGTQACRHALGSAFGRGLSPAVLAATLIGCSNPAYQKMQTDAAERARNVTITCVDSKDCNVKWARATQWVSENSYFKLRIANDSIITTEGPLNSAAIAHNSAMSVNRLPKGDGTSTIAFKSWCANEFGCVPSHEILLTRFADFVNGGQPAGQR